MTIKTYIEKIRKTKTTPEETTQFYLREIAKYDHLNAVIALNPQALEDAKTADPGTPLAGLPILIKDNINTGDETATSAGSVALADNQPVADAPLAKNLREAGAIFLGKSNMTEFANYMVDYREYQGMPNGYSSRGGQTVHPLDEVLGHYVNPSGSSTGSAVAVATGQAIAAIGSETYGSIISPSQRLGIVGLKPTAASVDMSAVIPISATLDIAGPMVTCVEDAAILLGVMQGKLYPVEPNWQTRIGVYSPAGKAEEEDVVALNQAVLEKWVQAGASVVNDKLAAIDEGFVFDIMRYEFKASINSYLKKYGTSQMKTLADIIAYNEAHAAVALKYGQNNLMAGNQIGDDWETQPVYVTAINNRNQAIADLENYFVSHQVEVVWIENAHCGLAAATGFPSMTVPIGKDKQGHPVGCCLVANRNREDILINAAAVIEQIIRGDQ